ncbi:MAG: TonB-dependent siderophore receptor [Pseudomonadota bacterium]
MQYSTHTKHRNKFSLQQTGSEIPSMTRPTSCRARQIVAAAVALAVMGMQAPAFAADSNVEEIVVVGQGVGSLRLTATNTVSGRLGLTALETPASIDLITGEEIATKGDYSALDAITRSAGLSSTANNGNGGLQVSSRGFDGHNTTINTYDGIRLYVTAGTVSFPADTWTLDRVEVLRGAGSVINGIGALATTINYVSKAPVFGESSFESLVAGGSFGLRRVAAGGGAQINDQLAYRLDGAYTDEDGYVDRADEQRKVVAGSLLYKPTDTFSMKFSIDHANIDAGNYWGTPLINGEASRSMRENNYNFTDGLVEYDDTWSRVHTEWQLAPSLLFRNDTFLINAKREWQNLEEYYQASDTTLDRMSYLGIIHDQEQIGTRSDFLLTSNFGNMENRFSIGAEINNIEMDYLNNFNTGGFNVSDTVPLFGFTPGYRPAAPFTQLDYSTDTRQNGYFFDDVLELNDKLSIVFGGRYDKFDFDRVNQAQVTGRARSEFDAGFSKFTWRTGLVYKVTNTMTLYAQTSTAADPVTSPISINLANADFKLSEGRQYEVGLKQQLMDGRAEYTLAYFDIEKDNLVTRLPGTLISQQIGQQSSDGLEVTFRLNPLMNVSVDFNAAFVDSKFDNYYSGPDSLAGNTPSNIPDTTANLWVNWAPITQLHLGAGMRYVDERYADDTNTRTMPEYTVFDASASWTVSEQMSVVLRARNFTDEKDYVLSEYVPEQWVFGEPRAYEVSVRYAF